MSNAVRSVPFRISDPRGDLQFHHGAKAAGALNHHLAADRLDPFLHPEQAKMARRSALNDDFLLHSDPIAADIGGKGPATKAQTHLNPAGLRMRDRIA